MWYNIIYNIYVYIYIYVTFKGLNVRFEEKKRAEKNGWKDFKKQKTKKTLPIALCLLTPSLCLYAIECCIKNPWWICDNALYANVPAWEDELPKPIGRDAGMSKIEIVSHRGKAAGNQNRSFQSTFQWSGRMALEQSRVHSNYSLDFTKQHFNSLKCFFLLL